MLYSSKHQPRLSVPRLNLRINNVPFLCSFTGTVTNSLTEELLSSSVSGMTISGRERLSFTLLVQRLDSPSVAKLVPAVSSVTGLAPSSLPSPAVNSDLCCRPAAYLFRCQYSNQFHGQCRSLFPLPVVTKFVGSIVSCSCRQ
jgi:hypothetical protein